MCTESLTTDTCENVCHLKYTQNIGIISKCYYATTPFAELVS